MMMVKLLRLQLITMMSLEWSKGEYAKVCSPECHKGFLFLKGGQFYLKLFSQFFSCFDEIENGEKINFLNIFLGRRIFFRGGANLF